MNGGRNLLNVNGGEKPAENEWWREIKVSRCNEPNQAGEGTRNQRKKVRNQIGVGQKTRRKKIYREDGQKDNEHGGRKS